MGIPFTKRAELEKLYGNHTAGKLATQASELAARFAENAAELGPKHQDTRALKFELDVVNAALMRKQRGGR